MRQQPVEFRTGRTIHGSIPAVFLTLILLAAAFPTSAANEQEYIDYANSVAPTANSLSHLLMSLSEISQEIAQLDSTNCKAIINLHEDFFKSTLTYYQGLRPPAGLNKVHDKLVTAMNKFITSLGYFNRFCTSRDTIDINTATKYMSQGSSLMFEAAEETKKFSDNPQFD